MAVSGRNVLTKNGEIAGIKGSTARMNPDDRMLGSRTPWGDRKKSAASLMVGIPGTMFVVLLMVILLNWIWVKVFGGTSALLCSYFVDANGMPVDYIAWNGQAYPMYYWDVFGYLGALKRPFEALSDSFRIAIESMNDFSALPEPEWYEFWAPIINALFFVLNILLLLLKLILFFPLSMIAAIFQAFMSTWVEPGGWLYAILQWKFTYV